MVQIICDKVFIVYTYVVTNSYIDPCFNILASSLGTMLPDLVIRGEPERAPNTQETGSGVYIFYLLYLYIYLCVILHSNDLMCMLNHHVLECDQ